MLGGPIGIAKFIGRNGLINHTTQPMLFAGAGKGLPEGALPFVARHCASRRLPDGG
jgi:hypothetical protein